MTNRERTLAILHYEKYDKMPIVHFAFWRETIEKWINEGHLSAEKSKEIGMNGVANKLGFDFEWGCGFGVSSNLFPMFESKVIKEFPDGLKHIFNNEGVIVSQKAGAGSIPGEIAHTLVDRKSWEEHYLPKLQYEEKRINMQSMSRILQNGLGIDAPIAYHVGSLYGIIRNWAGVEGTSYLYADDEELFDEMIATVGDLCYKLTKKVIDLGLKIDVALYWEDICFKNGPLIIPSVFNEKVGPQYKKISELLNKSGVKIISVDCDGMIDSLIPTWLENGVNTMFPIEVGTWNASIEPWRKKYGAQIRGVGGMDKKVFAYDYVAIDKEIERLKPLIALGGFIPCPDHRIAPDAKWENVQYYCDQMLVVCSW